jgi:hypothetical protein
MLVLPPGRTNFRVAGVNRSSPETPPTILSPQTEALDELLVPGVILSLEVVDQAPSLADDLQQTAPRMVIFLVVLEVLGKLSQPRREQGHLDLGRSGVRIVVLVSVDSASFYFGRDQLLFL